jgi:DNA-binding SARP family transcriptional activator
MEHLRIRLFGGLEIHRGNVLLPAFPIQQSERLFAYLVLHRERLIHRDVLCGQLWGELGQAEARKSLRNALWRIRSVLEPADVQRGAFLRVEGHLVGFVGSTKVWVDTSEFEEVARAAALNGQSRLDEQESMSLQSAVALYQGDFLEGHYSEWCLQQRERLRLIYLTALERLVAHHHESAHWLETILWGRKLLQHDPLREHIHRAVMAAHQAMGDRPSALRQYQLCAAQLREELEIDPMEETRRLHDRIRDDEPLEAGAGYAGAHRRGQQRTARELAGEVGGALKDLYELAERLEATRQALLSDKQE